MNSLIIGFGTMGRRHKAILDSLDLKTFTVSQHRIKSDDNFHTISEAVYAINPEYVVIANETCKHFDSVIELSKTAFRGKLLVEKPLDFKAFEFSQLGFQDFGVAFNLRFLPILEHLRKELESKKSTVYSVEIYYGNHYKNWRSSLNTNSQYSASRSRGGGIIRDFSHEIDLIYWLFGYPKVLFAMGGKIGTLTLDSDDMWNISMRTSMSPFVSLHLNSLDASPKREIRIILAERTITVDLIANKMCIDKEEINFSVGIEETYKLMHLDFLKGNGKTASLKNGLDVDGFIHEVETIADRT